MDQSSHVEGQLALLREEWIPDYHACLGAVARERKFLAAIEPPALDRTRTFARRLMSRGDPFIVWVDPSKRGPGRILGWCDIARFEQVGMGHRGVLGMGVAPGYRGAGIGRAMLIEALRVAENIGIQKVELEVYHDNKAAMKLYQSLGFIIEGRKEMARYLDGQWQSILLLARTVGIGEETER